MESCGRDKEIGAILCLGLGSWRVLKNAMKASQALVLNSPLLHSWGWTIYSNYLGSSPSSFNCCFPWAKQEPVERGPLSYKAHRRSRWVTILAATNKRWREVFGLQKRMRSSFVLSQLMAMAAGVKSPRKQVPNFLMFYFIIIKKNKLFTQLWD